MNPPHPQILYIVGKIAEANSCLYIFRNINLFTQAADAFEQSKMFPYFCKMYWWSNENLIKSVSIVGIKLIIITLSLLAMDIFETLVLYYIICKYEICMYDHVWGTVSGRKEGMFPRFSDYVNTFFLLLKCWTCLA